MPNENAERCPYCFNKFSELKYTNDPILTKDGSSFVYNETSGLLVPQTGTKLYKGSTIVKNKHITELQEIHDDNKPSGGWTPVEGEAGSFWIPNKIHIKELRDAIEKGLGIISPSDPNRPDIMEQFLNYDEEGTERQYPHQMDWNDPTLTGTVWMGNISHMHIEDLRKTVFLYNNFASASRAGGLTVIQDFHVILGTQDETTPNFNIGVRLSGKGNLQSYMSANFVGENIPIGAPYYSEIYTIMNDFGRTGFNIRPITPTSIVSWNGSATRSVSYGEMFSSSVYLVLGFSNNTTSYIENAPANVNVYQEFITVNGRPPLSSEYLYSVSIDNTLQVRSIVQNPQINPKAGGLTTLTVNSLNYLG